MTDVSSSGGADEGGELVAADAGAADQVAFAPSDNTTLTSVLDGLAAEGYHAHLTAEEGGSIRCGACDETTPASKFRVDSVRRLEGASEPDEMMSVVAACCPRCGECGVAVLGHGPVASAADLDVSSRLDMTNAKRDW